LFYPVISSVNADNVQRGRSLWAGRIGEKVAASKLTVFDDGLMPKGVGSLNFDFEGVPRQKTPIITRGKLEASSTTPTRQIRRGENRQEMPIEKATTCSQPWQPQTS